MVVPSSDRAEEMFTRVCLVLCFLFCWWKRRAFLHRFAVPSQFIIKSFCFLLLLLLLLLLLFLYIYISSSSSSSCRFLFVLVCFFVDVFRFWFLVCFGFGFVIGLFCCCYLFVLLLWLFFCMVWFVCLFCSFFLFVFSRSPFRFVSFRLPSFCFLCFSFFFPSFPCFVSFPPFFIKLSWTGRKREGVAADWWTQINEVNDDRKRSQAVRTGGRNEQQPYWMKAQEKGETVS